jgi:two-component system cell cycle sensor histidine kinase/response regulator CckA
MSPSPAPQFESTPGQATIPSVWWKHLFGDSDDPQVVCDRDGVVCEVNRRASERFQLSVGARLLQCPMLAPGAAAQLREALDRGTEKAETLGTVGITCAEGTCLVADLQVVPLDSGRWLLVIRDASRRWRLETHTQRLVAAIDSTPDVVVLTDAQFRVTFVNPAFEDATGYSIEEALGQPVDFCQASMESSKTREYQDGVARGADWVGELTMVRKDGSQFPVEMTFSPIHNHQGELIGAVAFQRDISARRRIHDAFQAEKNFVRSIINSLDASLYTLDGKFRLTHLNEGWRKMPMEHGWLRIEGEPQVGQSLLDYIPDPAKRAELERVFNLVLTEGRPQELQSVDAGGRHWVMSAFPWQHEGTIRGLIYKVTDNSAFIGIQSQLFQAQKMGTIGALAAGVAHDFNNMLLAIRGNLSLAFMDNQISKETRERLNQVDSAAERAVGLTQQLLSFSHASEEKVVVLDFNEVIKDAASLAKRLLRSKVSIKLNPTETALKVQMDHTRASQLLLNLCINAYDAMPKGGTLTVTNALVDITPEQVSKYKCKSHAQFMRCSVADTGTGIPPEVLPRIFSPFFTTKEKGKGTGLGLSIVHAVVSKAGGFIEVESTVNQGTTFNVYLPIDTGPLTRTDTDVRRQIRKGTGRLLVVDDLDLVLEFAASFLKQAGYQVLTANSAEAALKILAQQKLPLDLVLTDYAMPDKNGWQLIQEISKRWPLTRCILASGYLDEEVRAEISRNTAVRILNKPYGMAEATTVVAEMLGKTG